MKTTHTSAWLVTIITALSIIAAPLAAHAQQASEPETVKFQLFSIGGAITGDRLKIDADFSQRHNIAVPAPFSVLVPRENGIERVANNVPDGPNGPFLQLSFVDQEQQPIEGIRLVPMSVPMGTNPSSRLKGLAALMANTIFEQATSGFQERNRDLVRVINVGGLPGIEVVGRYQDPELGLIYLRIVGIPNPNSTEGVFVIANVVHNQMELTKPEDFSRTRGGVMVREFKFLE